MPVDALPGLESVPSRRHSRRSSRSPFPDGISTPIIIANAHPGGSAGNGLRVEGFVFQSGNDGVTATGGQAVFAMRAKGLVIRGNRVEAGFSELFDLRETSAIVDQNHLSGPGGSCDICLAGPGVYRVTGNRLLGGGIPGILTVPAMNLRSRRCRAVRPSLRIDALGRDQQQ